MPCLINGVQLTLPEGMCSAIGGEPLYPPQVMDDWYRMQEMQYPQLVRDQYDVPVRSGSGGYAWSEGSPPTATVDYIRDSDIREELIYPDRTVPVPPPEQLPAPAPDTGSYWGGPGTWAKQFTPVKSYRADWAEDTDLLDSMFDEEEERWGLLR